MLVIALIPSQQDGNPGGLGPDAFQNELLQMRWFASVLARAASEYPEVIVRVFEGRPYSASSFRLQTLYENEEAAKAWLDGQEALGHFTLAINLHTDAGTVNQIGRYWDGRSPGSKAAADALIQAVHPFFPGAAIWGADYGATGYVFATVMRTAGVGKHRACLLELGTHERIDHTTILRQQALPIAHALLGAACKLAGVRGRDPFPVGRCGPGVEGFLRANPEYGFPRLGLTHWDSVGNEYCWTTRTPKHPNGCLVVWRKWRFDLGKQPIDVMTWE